MEIVDLRVTRNERLLERVYHELYLQFFTDPDEQEDLEQYRDRLFGPQQPIPQPVTHFLVAGTNLNDAETARIDAFHIFELYRESSCGLLTYIAVKPDARQRGLSRTLIRKAIDILSDECLGPEGVRAVFAEIHNPAMIEDGGDSMPPHSRLKAMTRLGAYRVPVRYVQPVLRPGANPSDKLLLIAFPVQEGSAVRVRGGVVLDFLEEFYRALGVPVPADNAQFLTTCEDLRAVETGAVRPEILELATQSGLPLATIQSVRPEPERSSPWVMLAWWALAAVWFLAFPWLVQPASRFAQPVPHADEMLGWGWRDAMYYGAKHSGVFLANVIRGAGVFIILGLSYRLPYLFLVHSTFPADEPLRPQWSWKILLRPFASLRRIIEMLFYYRSMISLPAVRRFVYVATHPVFSRHVFNLSPDRVFLKLQIYFETELFRQPVDGETAGEAGEDIASKFCRNVFLFDSGQAPRVECDSCFDVFGHNNQKIEKYFLAQMRVHRDPSFLSRVEFLSGYLAPAYLVSGLLNEFDEDWTKIVRAYPEKLKKLESGEDSLSRLPDLRKLQSFIWDCWVQWGPSVPISESVAWQTGEIALQYGYGDENNSLPLRLNRRLIGQGHQLPGDDQGKTPETAVGWNGFRYSNWDDRLGTLLAQGVERTARAWPVRAEGRLRWLMRADRNSRFCLAQRNRNPSSKGWLVLDADALTADPSQPKFYSAYVWVIIAICRTSDSGQVELSEPDLADQWRCLIPFFQHGNIAEPSVYDSIKRELAEKTIGILLTELQRAQVAGLDWMRFHYVAAYDDSGDGSSPLGPPPAEDTSVLHYLRDVLERRQQSGELDSSLAAKIDCNSPVAGLSASDLPHIVRTYLDHIEAVTSKTPTAATTSTPR